MLDIVKQDAWLEPVAQAVRERYERYQRRYDGLVQQYGSLANFATAHKFFGFNYDKMRHGWWYREFAPAASYLSLTGDFNGWQRFDHPLEYVGYGIWVWFRAVAQFAGRLVHGSLL